LHHHDNKGKNIRMKKHINLLVGCLLILTACTTVGPKGSTPSLNKESLTPSGKPVETATPSLTVDLAQPPTDGPTPTLPPATYYQFEPGVNPLTGLPVADPANLNRRPVMVKVSNWPREGRPHAGLTSADLVFEYFIGHQMNRFLAIYYGENADEIGPVRSGRLVDAQLVELYQGLLAYGSADPQVDEVLSEALGERIFSFPLVSCPVMCGETTHSATGVYANSSALTDYAVSIGVDNAPPDLRGMFFQDDPPPGDQAGTLLRVEYANFSIMQWHYDPENGNYALWMEAEIDEVLDLAPMTDRNNDEPVTFDNLIVMFAEYIEYAPSLHDIVLWEADGYQPALLFRDGKVTYGTWRVPETDRPIIFETAVGDPMPLKPGKSWIVIVGLNSRTVQPAGGEWEIYFELP